MQIQLALGVCPPPPQNHKQQVKHDSFHPCIKTSLWRVYISGRSSDSVVKSSLSPVCPRPLSTFSCSLYFVRIFLSCTCLMMRLFRLKIRSIFSVFDSSWSYFIFNSVRGFIWDHPVAERVVDARSFLSLTVSLALYLYLRSSLFLSLCPFSLTPMVQLRLVPMPSIVFL